jgi:hypothetical protein
MEIGTTNLHFAVGWKLFPPFPAQISLYLARILTRFWISCEEHRFSFRSGEFGQFCRLIWDLNPDYYCWNWLNAGRCIFNLHQQYQVGWQWIQWKAEEVFFQGSQGERAKLSELVIGQNWEVSSSWFHTKENQFKSSKKKMRWNAHFPTWYT